MSIFSVILQLENTIFGICLARFGIYMILKKETYDKLMDKSNKAGKKITMEKMQIVEKHITGISHICNICGKSVKSRYALRMHKQTAQGHQSA